MGGKNESSGDIGSPLRSNAQHSRQIQPTTSEPETSPRPLIPNTDINVSAPLIHRDWNPKLESRKPARGKDALDRSTLIKPLVKAVRQADQRKFSDLLIRCAPLSMCIADHPQPDTCRNSSDHHNIRCEILNTIIEELLTCSTDASGIIEALIKTGFDSRGAHETINGRRLWFWAALKNHTNLLSYMLVAGFPIDQGIVMHDRTILTKALPSDSDTLPQGITALFAALIANAYAVALDLIERGATLRLHFHEQHDFYTVPSSGKEDRKADKTVAVDAMMVLAPRFPKTLPTHQNSFYLGVIKSLLSRGLDPSLPSNLWIKASSVFFMSLSQGRPSHQYVQEISFVMKVALYGHVDVMKILVAAGANVEARAFHGLSLLHFATRSTNLEMANYVAELIDDVDIQDDFGYSALHHAVALDLPDIVKALLEYDADVDLLSKNGLSPLHLAVSLKHVEMCELLLQHEADVNTNLSPIVTTASFNHAADWYDLTTTEMVFGSTPLISALCPDKMVYVYTVSRGSDSDVTDSDSSSGTENPLKRLMYHDDNGSEESLCIEISEHNNSGTTSTQSGGIRDRLVRVLLQHGAETGKVGCYFQKRIQSTKRNRNHDWDSLPMAYEVEWCYPLSLACKTTTEAWSAFTQTSLRNVRGTSNVVRSILEAIGSKLTPHMLSEAFSAACFTDMKMDGSGRGYGRFRLSCPTIDLLLDNGANVNQRNNQNLTLLHLACIPWTDDGDQGDLIDQILHNGAHLEARCQEGKTPLHWAAAWNLDALKILLQHGAETCVNDHWMRDPLYYICSNPDSKHNSQGLHLLLQHRYHKETKVGIENRLAMICDNKWTASECEMLNYLIDPEFPQNTTFALTNACQKRCIASLTAICQYSQFWQIYGLRDQGGATPLIEAVKTGSSDIVSLMLRGITVAYHDERLVSAVSSLGSAGNARQFKFTDIPDSFKQHGTPISAKFSPKSAESDYSNETLHRPPPIIDGLLFSEQHFQRKRLMLNSNDLKDYNTLDPSKRAACLNTQDHRGWTALHYALAQGDGKILRLLLEEPDLDLEPTSSLCQTPLGIIAAFGRDELLEMYVQAISSRRSRMTGQSNDGSGGAILQPTKSYVGGMFARPSKWFTAQCRQMGAIIDLRRYEMVLVLLIVAWSLWRASEIATGEQNDES